VRRSNPVAANGEIASPPDRLRMITGVWAARNDMRIAGVWAARNDMRIVGVWAARNDMRIAGVWAARKDISERDIA
jgi:hypothetical protein